MSDSSDAATPDVTAAAADHLYSDAIREADELGARSIDVVTADLIRQVARMTGAQSTVCISPSPAVPALAVLAAVGPDAGLTLIDGDPHHVASARKVLGDSEFDASHVRFITARPVDVLGKLADGNYDLVVADVEDEYVGGILSRCADLLRTGGALILSGEVRELPDDVELPAGSHLSTLPIGPRGLTLLTF